MLIASLMHGAINLSQGFFLRGVDPARTYWLLAAAYGSATLVLTLVFGASLSRKHQVGVDLPECDIRHRAVDLRRERAPGGYFTAKSPKRSSMPEMTYHTPKMKHQKAKESAMRDLRTF